MQQLIRDLETILASSESEIGRIKLVAERLGTYVGGRPSLAPKFTRPGKETYARRLMHRDPLDRFVVVAMTWGPGQGTPVHDHGTWGVVGMIENSIAAWVYRRRDDGTREGYAEIEETGYTEAEAGAVLPVVFPPDDEIHRLRNKEEQVAIGIHIYGKDIERCRRFDLETKRWEWYGLKYTAD